MIDTDATERGVRLGARKTMEITQGKLITEA